MVRIAPKRALEILQKVYFEFDAATILPRSYPLLDQIAAVMEEHPEITHVRVEGHTDNIGTAEYNQNLSQARAEAVRAYLVEAGVEPNRLSASGFGYSRPIDSNDTEEGRAKNRRVEFLIAPP